MTIKQQQGSFLLEFLIALAIFSIAIIGLVKLQNRSISDLGDLGADMAIPILVSDFTSRANLEEGGSVTGTSLTELQETARAMMKTVTVNGATITITDVVDPTKKASYTVELDNSRIVADIKPKP